MYSNFSVGYLINVNTWDYLQLPFISRPRIKPAVGVVETVDGDVELVVAGGEDDYEELIMNSTEIFSLRHWAWREGPRLPHNMSRADTIQVNVESSPEPIWHDINPCDAT